MTSAKYEVEKLWFEWFKIVEGEPKFGASMMEKDKKMLLEKANNDIVLSLGGRGMRRRLHRNYGLSLRACR